MDFGLFLLSPQLDRSRSAEAIVRETADLAVHAEALGFSRVWVAEHHFANLSLSPSPLLTLSHLAARTQRIRLGTGVLVLPLYQPLRLVEEIAYVDVISDGRLDIGVGGGSQKHESRGFQTDLAESHARTLEVLDIMHMAFETGQVTYEGEYFQILSTPLSVRPVQHPHPPVYVAGMSADVNVTRRIAERGYTAFASLFGPASGAPAVKREEVLQGFDAAGVPRDRCRYAGQRLVYVTDDPADARDAAGHALMTLRAVSTLKSANARFHGPFVEAEPMSPEPDLETLLDASMIGSPAKIAAMIQEDRDHLSPEHFSCFMQFGGLDKQRTLNSMQRFMNDVVPIL